MVVEWQPGERQAWRPTNSDQATSELMYRQILSGALGAVVTALALGEQYIYTGMADGRIIVSADRGITWQPDRRIPQGGAVAAFWVDSANPRVALAVVASRVLHTIDGGLSWDDLSRIFPTSRSWCHRGCGGQRDLPCHGSGRLLHAHQSQCSERCGCFLEPAGGLPLAAASDVKLDSGAIQLWVALKDWGYIRPWRLTELVIPG
jgi:hypothetical protein